MPNLPIEYTPEGFTHGVYFRTRHTSLLPAMFQVTDIYPDITLLFEQSSISWQQLRPDHPLGCIGKIDTTQPGMYITL